MTKPPVVVQVEEKRPIVSKSFRQARLEQESRQSSFFAHVGKMRSFISFVVLTIGGTALIMAWPLALMVADPKKVPDILDARLEVLNSVSQNYIRFSILAAVSYNTFLISHFVVQLLPWILKHSIILIFGYCSEATSEKLESIPSVHFPFVRLATFAVTDVIYFILFNRMTIIPAWQTIANILLVLSILSFFLLIQRIAMVKLARNFHKVAAKERLVANKFAISTIDKLTRAVRTIGIIDLPIALAMAAANKRHNRNSGSHAKYDVGDSSDSVRSESVRTATDDLNQHDEGELPANGNREVEEKKRHWQGSSLIRSMGINDLEAGVPNKKNRFLELAGDFDAKNLGQRIFNGLTEGHQSSILFENFRPYFDSEEEARAGFKLFDVNDDGSIVLPELIAVIMRSFREKRALIAALNDLNSVVEHLNQILYGLSGFATFLASLPILGISFTSVVSLSSLFLGLSFIFGNTAKSTFDSIVFIFVHHPFDAGDRVFIDDKNYLVHEMGLLYTSFNEAGKIVYFPNSFLAGKIITNVRRSGNMIDFVKVTVDFYTDQSKLLAVQDRLEKFCLSHPTRFVKTKPDMDLFEIGAASATYSFSINHLGSWQDGGKRWSSRTMFLFELKKAMEDLDIKFTVAPVRVEMFSDVRF